MNCPRRRIWKTRVAAILTHSVALRGSKRDLWLPALLVFCLGLAIAIPLRGHFLKPHADFIGFHDAADMLAAGRFDESHKRAPLYPALLACGGELYGAFVPGNTPPRLAFAEWLNALLLPVNAMLVLLIARQGLHALSLPPLAASWTAIAFLLLPLSMSLTAHVLVEPLLTSVMLGTIAAAAFRRRTIAYGLAALAALTRYDAAGLLFGLAAADILNKENRSAIRCGFLAAAPLAIWLALTAIYWSNEVGDHYLKQIYDSPCFSPYQAARVIFDAAFNLPVVHLPAWIDLDALLVRLGLRFLFAGCAILGGWLMLRARDRAAIVAAWAGAAYWLVHALFPFSFDRFGYPLAPLVLIAGGIGATRVVLYLRWPNPSACKPGHIPGEGPVQPPASHQVIGTPVVRALVVSGFALFALLLLLGNLENFLAALRGPRASLYNYLLTCALGTSIVAILLPRLPAWPAGAAVFLGFIPWFAPAQLREACGQLGSGEDRANLVTAAKWIVKKCPPDAVVLTDLGGFVRIYGNSEGPGTIGFCEIAASSWSEIIAELRTRRISHITWHADIFAEFADPFYAARWRLARFSQLGGDATPPEVHLLAELPGDPTVRIFAFR